MHKPAPEHMHTIFRQKRGNFTETVNPRFYAFDVIRATLLHTISFVVIRRHQKLSIVRPNNHANGNNNNTPLGPKIQRRLIAD